MHRRRRPSGAAPPLPKQIGLTGWVWLVALAAVVVTGCLWLRADPGPLDRFDAWITDAVVSVNSKSGAEAVLLGKPVVVMGDAFYRSCPLVFAADRLKDVPQGLCRT